jgi:hypothetical protein
MHSCLRLEILEFVRVDGHLLSRTLEKKALTKNNNEPNTSGNSITNSVQGTLLCGPLFLFILKYPRTETSKDQGSLKKFLTQRLLWSSRDVLKDTR